MSPHHPVQLGHKIQTSPHKENCLITCVFQPEKSRPALLGPSLVILPNHPSEKNVDYSIEQHCNPSSINQGTLCIVHHKCRSIHPHLHHLAAYQQKSMTAPMPPPKILQTSYRHSPFTEGCHCMWP